MKKILTLLLIINSLTFFCQPELTYLDSNAIPKKLHFKGKIKSAVKWSDKLDVHIVLTTETGKYFNQENCEDAELFAYHYVENKDSLVLLWKVYDFIKCCSVDIEAQFIKNTFQITDLDQNGTPEVWLMYKTVCHGDVSPCDMKIIMYEGTKKYAMRGRNKVEYEPGNFEGGEFKFDKTFLSGSKFFTDFAKKLWDKNIMQTWGQ